MGLYRFYGHIHGGHVVGLVKANNVLEAEANLRKVYDDWDLWKYKEIEPVEFDSDNVSEIFYG